MGALASAVLGPCSSAVRQRLPKHKQGSHADEALKLQDLRPMESRVPQHLRLWNSDCIISKAGPIQARQDLHHGQPSNWRRSIQAPTRFGSSRRTSPQSPTEAFSARVDRRGEHWWQEQQNLEHEPISSLSSYRPGSCDHPSTPDHAESSAPILLLSCEQRQLTQHLRS